MTSRTLLYVGGLSEDVNEKVLEGAFITFGPILQCIIPREGANQRGRGFGFVEFEEPDDAEQAVLNMHGAELFGRVLTVNPAKINAIRQMSDIDQKEMEQG